MFKVILVVILVSTLALAGCTSSITHLKPNSVMIFAGQSNSLGMGALVSSLGQAQYTTIPNVLMWNTDHWEQYYPAMDFNSYYGPEYSFLLAWSQDHPTQTLGVIKYSFGGTSMGDWQVNYDPTLAARPVVGSLYTGLMSTYQAAGSLPVLGMIWAQGESDAVEATPGASENYAYRIEQFITALRSQWGVIPWVLAESQWNQTSDPACCLATIQTEQTNLATTWPRIGMAQTVDLNTVDGVHFDWQAQITLGQRMYAIWRNL